MPPYPGEKPLPVRDYAALYRELKIDGNLGRQALLHAPESGVDGVGSNNWVVAGSHTVSGKALLANDPHLRLTAPALWYFARLEAPGFKVAGATMPGLPLVVLGSALFHFGVGLAVLLTGALIFGSLSRILPCRRAVVICVA